LAKKEHEKIDYSILQKQLAAWQSVKSQPLIFKNIIQVSFNIDKIIELFPNAFFIHIKRKPEFVVQSTYQARKKLFNTSQKWLGLKPPEYNAIKLLPLFEQITAQVYYSKKHIDKALERKNSMSVQYEDLIKNPEEILLNIGNNLHIKQKNVTILSLKNTNTIKIQKEEFSEIKQYCNKYFN